MFRRYQIIYKGKIVAFGYVEEHHFLKDHSKAVINPITYEGKWEDSTLKVTYTDIISDVFPKDIGWEDQIKALLGRYRAEWGKDVIMKEIDGWGHIRGYS